MIPVYQTIFAIPGGNCLQASLASILELPLDSVPHFANIDSDDWWQQLQTWCKQYGIYPVYIPAENQASDAFQGYHLVAVKTPCGSDHMTVGKNGKIIHDPAGRLHEDYKIIGYVVFISLMMLEKIAGI